MNDNSDNISMFNFEQGMTVKELKEIIKKWPETDNEGEDCEVWIKTGRCESSPVVCAGALNRREDDEGNISADFILGSMPFRSE